MKEKPKFDTYDPPRRPRNQRVSSGRRVYLNERDLTLAEALHRHGDLSVPYLHMLTRHVEGGSSEKALTHRMTVLYHEGYLERPPQQFGTLDARYQHLIYANTRIMERILARADRFHEYAPRVSNRAWVHDYGCGCITASIEIATRAAEGYRYIHQDEILGTVSKGLAFDVGMRVSGRPVLLKPDRIFGIRYPTGKTKFFLLEHDRATESERRTRPNVKSIERMATQYKRLIRDGRYKELLGLPGGLMVITVTTSAARMRTMREVWEEVYGGPVEHALFTHIPYFAGYYKPPPPLPELFERAYERPGADPYLIRLP